MQTAVDNALAAAEKDVKAVRQEYLVRPPPWLSKAITPWLNDRRDAPVLFLLCNLLCTTLPAAVTLFVLPPNPWLGAVYLVLNYGLFLQRFLLALHYSEHRRLFRQGIAADTARHCRGLMWSLLHRCYGAVQH